MWYCVAIPTFHDIFLLTFPSKSFHMLAIHKQLCTFICVFSAHFCYIHFLFQPLEGGGINCTQGHGILLLKVKWNFAIDFLDLAFFRKVIMKESSRLNVKIVYGGMPCPCTSIPDCSCNFYLCLQMTFLRAMPGTVLLEKLTPFGHNIGPSLNLQLASILHFVVCLSWPCIDCTFICQLIKWLLYHRIHWIKKMVLHNISCTA